MRILAALLLVVVLSACSGDPQADYCDAVEQHDAEEPPADLDPADRADIAAAARQLGSEQTVSAMSGVEQHALDVCGTPLSR